jgi:hypothetical protein
MVKGLGRRQYRRGSVPGNQVDLRLRSWFRDGLHGQFQVIQRPLRIQRRMGRKVSCRRSLPSARLRASTRSGYSTHAMTTNSGWPWVEAFRNSGPASAGRNQRPVLTSPRPALGAHFCQFEERGATHTGCLRATRDEEMRKMGPSPKGCGENRAILHGRP